jgi:hypothetical protein
MKANKGQLSSEAIEQRKLFNWAKMMQFEYPELSLLFAIPNGGHRNAIEAKNLKMQGVKPGVSDIFLPVPRHGLHGLWLELKYGKGKLSEHQKKWLEDMKEQGYGTSVCYSYEEARNVITSYLEIDK